MEDHVETVDRNSWELSLAYQKGMSLFNTMCILHIKCKIFLWFPFALGQCQITVQPPGPSPGGQTLMRSHFLSRWLYITGIQYWCFLLAWCVFYVIPLCPPGCAPGLSWQRSKQKEDILQKVFLNAFSRLNIGILIEILLQWRPNWLIRNESPSDLNQYWSSSLVHVCVTIC